MHASKLMISFRQKDRCENMARMGSISVSYVSMQLMSMSMCLVLSTETCIYEGPFDKLEKNLVFGLEGMYMGW